MLVLLTLLSAAPPTTVVIDPGHDSAEPGALGTRGVPEVVFNDELAAALSVALGDDPALRVVVTRRPEELLDLAARARRMNDAAPALVVSLHHDSVQPQFLSYRDVEGIAVPTCTAHAGFSLFAQDKGPHRAASQRFAAAVARRYQALGLVRTTYHALDVEGERRRWIDERLGIHAGDHLYILRKVDAPVVLVESGFVVHPGDEARLADPAHRRALAAALAAAVREALSPASRPGPG